MSQYITGYLLKKCNMLHLLPLAGSNTAAESCVKVSNAQNTPTAVTFGQRPGLCGGYNEVRDGVPPVK